MGPDPHSIGVWAPNSSQRTPWLQCISNLLRAACTLLFDYLHTRYIKYYGGTLYILINYERHIKTDRHFISTEKSKYRKSV